jgi:3-phosphoshikimate 1-carboxyvinyltransferase
LQTAAEERIIRPAKNVYGSLRLPGDKSISHRYGMLVAFAERPSSVGGSRSLQAPECSRLESRPLGPGLICAGELGWGPTARKQRS